MTNPEELSPLQEIERRVQVRAKEISLEMGGDAGKAKLRALIDEEVNGWSVDYQRGVRAFDLADREVVAERAFRNLAGYGPLEPLLADDDVWEIMVGPLLHLRICAKPQVTGHRRVCVIARQYALVRPACGADVVQMWCSRSEPGLRTGSAERAARCRVSTLASLLQRHRRR